MALQPPVENQQALEIELLHPLPPRASRRTVAVPPKKFYDVASSSTKYKDMPGERLFVQYVLHLRTQSIKTATQICHARCNPDLGPNRKLDHLRRLSRIDRTREGSAPLSTLIIARPGSSTWIAPPAGAGTSPVSLSSSLVLDHCHRNQRCAGLVQFATLKRATPLEDLVRVHTVRSRHLGNTGARLQRQLHDLKLL